MVAFPDTIAPVAPMTTSHAFRTLFAGPYDNGRKVRQAARAFPLFRARVKFPREFSSRYVSLFQFYLDRRGSYESFTWFDFCGQQLPVPGKQWPQLLIGVRDGTTTVYDLPYKGGATGYVIQDAGSTMLSGYTISAGAGTDGRDRITFDDGGTEGHVMTAAAYGRAAFNVVFTDDELSFENWWALVTTVGFGIEEVRD